MVRKMLILKTMGALALLGATAGGIAAGVANGPIVSSKAMEIQSTATETPSASPKTENPGTDLRNTEILPKQAFGVENRIWGSGSAEKNWLKPYECNLTKKNRTFERSYYSINAVKRQTKEMLAALSNFNLQYSDEMVVAVYNFVQMIDDENVDGTVAWETKGQIKEGKRDIGMIYLEGGPISNARFDIISDWNLNRLDMGAFFVLKEAQFGLYPLQIVGRQGASATNNFYMQRLQSADSQKIKTYRKLYESGFIANNALLWAIAGNLDLSQAQLYGAMSLATIIVGTARTSALTKQLYESGYERVSLVGISYGMTLGLTILANDLKLLDSLYRVSLGENVLGSGKVFYKDGTLSELIEQENANEKYAWNEGMFDINGSYNIKTMLKNLFKPAERPLPHQEKIAIHVARDDDHNWTNLYDSEERYFEQTLGIANYQQYDYGGHGIWFIKKELIEWMMGLGPNERWYD